jgi:hypothetical protein
MLRTEPDGGGDPVPPPPKPGGSSPPPNGGSSPKNQPSNSDNGKKPEAGKNKNTKQPVAKKPAATQPVTTPKGETLEQAITRMRNQDVPEWQIRAQIQKWHPTWTDAQIAKTMEAAPGPGGYIDQAKANAAKGKNYGHPGNITELKTDVDKAVHEASGVARWVIVHAKHSRGLQEDAKIAKVLGREFDKHADTIAVVSSFLALATAEFPPAAFAFAALAEVASAEAGTHAALEGRRGEAALDFAGVAVGVRGALHRAAEKRALNDLAREVKKLEKVVRDAREGPLGEPSPRTGEIGTAAERREPAEIATRRRAAEERDLKARAAREIADRLALALSLSAWGHAKLLREIQAAFR